LLNAGLSGVRNNEKKQIHEKLPFMFLVNGVHILYTMGENDINNNNKYYKYKT